MEIRMQGFHWMYSWEQYVRGRERIGSSRGKNWTAVKLQQRPQLIPWVISGLEWPFRVVWTEVRERGLCCSFIDHVVFGYGQSLEWKRRLVWGSSLQQRAIPGAWLTVSHWQAIVLIAGRIKTSVLQVRVGRETWDVTCHYMYQCSSEILIRSWM